MFDLPIVVVKGANSVLGFFDSALINFTNNRVCYGAVNALQLLEDSPAEVVIVESDVGEMSGLELAEAIRDIDDERDRHTFIILIGAVAPKVVASDTFQRSIDMVTGTKRVDVMTHLAVAGARMARSINETRSANRSLEQLCNSLRKGQLLDPLTGLGNRTFAEQALNDTIRQTESRGGAACFLMMTIANYEAIKESYDTTIAGELVVAVSERIQSLVRPLDTVTYYGPGQFALILIQPSIEQCTADCYRRIYDGVKLKSYSTSVGFLPVEIAMSICAGTSETGPPSTQVMMNNAVDSLDESIALDDIVVKHIS